jgi:hypothetical protein
VLDAPVAVTRGLGLEIDGLHDLTGAGSKLPGGRLPLCIIIHIDNTSTSALQQRRLL